MNGTPSTTANKLMLIIRCTLRVN